MESRCAGSGCIDSPSSHVRVCTVHRQEGRHGEHHFLPDLQDDTGYFPEGTEINLRQSSLLPPKVLFPPLETWSKVGSSASESRDALPEAPASAGCSSLWDQPSDADECTDIDCFGDNP